MCDQVDVAGLLTDCPINKLRTAYQSRLLCKISDAFSTDEQRLFISSFYCFLNHHPTDDYVVDLDKIWRWLGYSRKDPAKRKLLQAFAEENDYRTIHSKVEGCGGQGHEAIHMNVETFKAFCLLAGTRKGAEVRTYYIRLERILHAVIQEQTSELEEQLRTEIASKEDRLQTEIAAKLELQQRLDQKGRRYKDAIKRQTVYIFREDDRLHKIGRSADMKKRESSASTFSYGGTMCHAVPCVNSKLLEDVVHHLLDKRRLIKTQEWFAVTLDEARAAVEAAQMFLDGHLEEPEKLSELLPHLQQHSHTDAAATELPPCAPPARAVETVARKRKHGEDEDLPLHVHRYRDSSGHQREGYIAHPPGHVAKSFYSKAYTLPEKLAQATLHVRTLLGEDVAGVDVPPPSDQEGRRKRAYTEELPKYLIKLDTAKQQGYAVKVPGTACKSFLSKKVPWAEKLRLATEQLAVNLKHVRALGYNV